MGVENTGNRYLNMDINLIWGLINSSYANNLNVSVVNQGSLYLPGYFNDTGTGQSYIDSDNLPAAQFYSGAMATAYNGPASSGAQASVDYTGDINMAMWARWQTLTQSASTAAQIPELIWTDNAASAVVGTKGVLGPWNAAHNNVVPRQVTPMASRIKYHWPFAVPALVAALGICLITLLAFWVILLGKGRLGRMTLHLKQVSPGRIFTTFLYPEIGAMATESKEWNKQWGKAMVDLSGDRPLAVDPLPENGGRVTENKRSGSDERSNAHDQSLAPDRATEASQGDALGP